MHSDKTSRDAKIQEMLLAEIKRQENCHPKWAMQKQQQLHPRLFMKYPAEADESRLDKSC